MGTDRHARFRKKDAGTARGIVRTPRRFEIPKQHVEAALAGLLVQVHWYESRCKDVPEHIVLAFEYHAHVLGKIIYADHTHFTQVK